MPTILHRSDVDWLFPEALTLEKALNLISCAAKQGRTDIRVSSNYSIGVELNKMGFETKSFKYLADPKRIFTIYW